MKVDLTIGIETDRPVEELLRHATAALAECEGCRVLSYGHAKRERTFTVIGALKGKPAETYRTVVTAENAKQAEERAIAEDPKRTAVAVFEGEVAPVSP
jgi:hypothetical protein